MCLGVTSSVDTLTFDQRCPVSPLLQVLVFAPWKLEVDVNQLTATAGTDWFLVVG